MWNFLQHDGQQQQQPQPKTEKLTTRAPNQRLTTKSLRGAASLFRGVYCLIIILLLNGISSAKYAIKFIFSTLLLVTALRTVFARFFRLFLSFVILWPISSSPFNPLVRFLRVGGDDMFYLRSSLTDWSDIYFSAASIIYDAMNRPPPKRIKFLFLSFRNLFINSQLRMECGGLVVKKEKKRTLSIERRSLQLIACSGLMINVSGDATVNWREKGSASALAVRTRAHWSQRVSDLLLTSNDMLDVTRECLAAEMHGKA